MRDKLARVIIDALGATARCGEEATVEDFARLEIDIGWLDGNELLDAILTTLRNNAAEDDELCMRGRSVLPEFDEPLLEDAAACFTAMIDHIRSGK